MIETIEFKGKRYPKFQSEGFAAKFIFPFADQVLKHCGHGYDVGCNRKEWAYPGAHPVDPLINGWDAMNLPTAKPDYIFSSHMLEHYPGSWVEVLDYWHSRLSEGGIVFLYLPHYSQEYWRSWNNKKHVHNFTPDILRDYFMTAGGWENVFVSEGADLNNSFCVMASKKVNKNLSGV